MFFNSFFLMYAQGDKLTVGKLPLEIKLLRVKKNQPFNALKHRSPISLLTIIFFYCQEISSRNAIQMVENNHL